MASTKTPVFAPRGSKADLETGLAFAPKFDGDGLIPAVVTDAGSGEALMFAFMNAEALALTIETGDRPLLEPFARCSLEEGRGKRQRA